MRPITIVLIVIIIVIALVMGFFMIISNERSKYGGPSLFDMMLREKEPSGEEGSGDSESKGEESGDGGDSVTVTENEFTGNAPAEDEKGFNQ
ncbi:MAG: hypothetical protein LIO56_05500 [Lachnospiraceae bacterium]|nr:hypothetical protein [Lachnospiraceae bacterium]